MLHPPTSLRRVYVVLALALFGCIALLITKHVVFPRILSDFFRLRVNEDGSLPATTKMWVDYPADIYYNFYLWNITNADEMIYEGAMPRVLEVGPYTYRGKEHKDNLTWSRDGNEVSYRNRRFWYFNRSLSCRSCTEDDHFVIPNAAYAATASMAMYNDMHSFIAAILDVSMLNMLKTMHGTFFGFKLPDYPHPGLLPLYNHTYEPEFRVKTGKEKIEDLTKIVSYGGKREMGWFMGEAGELHECNDGGMNKHFLQPEDKLQLFQSYLGRSLKLEFHKERSRDSIPTFVYRLEKDGFNTNAEKNVGMRYENVEAIDYAPTWPICPDHVYSPNNSRCAVVECSREMNFCDDCCNGSHYGPTVFLPPGFYPLRVFPGRLGRVPFAIFISLPHMLWAPKEVSSLYAGQRPDEIRHLPVEWEVNPIMGTLVHADMRAQMNIAFARGRMTLSSSLSSSITPIFWLHIEANVDGEEIVAMVKLIGLYTPLALNGALIVHLLIIIVSMSTLAVLEIYVHPKLKKRKPRKEEFPMPRIYTLERV